MSKITSDIVNAVKSTTIKTNTLTKGEDKEVAVSKDFFEMAINKNKKQNKTANIIIRVEPKLKKSFQKVCEKNNYAMSDILIAWVKEYVLQHS